MGCCRDFATDTTRRAIRDGLDYWWHWLPARFGLSDAAEMFVFLSGYATAIAFGGAFRRHGMFVGIGRVVPRCW